jgi:cyclohexadienyl dehydratase
MAADLTREQAGQGSRGGPRTGQKRCEVDRLGDRGGRVNAADPSDRVPTAARARRLQPVRVREEPGVTRAGRAAGSSPRRSGGTWIALLLAAACAAHAAEPGGAASGAAVGGSPGVLRVGTSGDYPPFSRVVEREDSRAWDGFDVAVARAYAEERGLALELVRFRWPDLERDLREGRFDVALSGVTIRPERSVAGRFGVPLVEGGAVLLVRTPGRWSSVEQLDQRRVRVGVNQGGHLEQVARRLFRHATLVVIPENAAVRDALLGWSVDAAVSDTFEAPLWLAEDDELGMLGPVTRDLKAPLLRPGADALAADLDAWLLAREADGSLARLRERWLPDAPAARTASPWPALLAAIDERLALMPWVGAAKREAVLPIADPAREKLVVDAGWAAVRAAAERARRDPPPEGAVRAFYQAQVEAAKQVQLDAGRDPGFEPPQPLPDLERELRPALLRIGERMAALLVALPSDLDPSAAHRDSREALRAPWLADSSRHALVEAALAIARP